MIIFSFSYIIVKSIDVGDRKTDVVIDYSEPTQEEIDGLLYADIHISNILNVKSIDVPLKWILTKNLMLIIIIVRQSKLFFNFFVKGEIVE